MKPFPESPLADLLASGISLFTQGQRLLKLRFASSSVVGEGVLLPHVLKGSEGLSSCYRYELDCLSADGFIELKDLLGQAVEIGLLLPEGGERLLTGLVTRGEQRGSDGGFSAYRLVIEPALATLGLRQNSRVFQDKTVIEIVSAILDEHLAANPVLAASFHYEDRTAKTYPPRSYCLQYRESDLAFIERLLAEEGINTRHTHGPDQDTSLRDSTAEEDSTDTPLHTLILFDADTPAIQGSATPVRFHRTDGVETADAIDTWQGARQLQSSASTLWSYDYQSVATHQSQEATQTRHGDAGQDLALTLEDYDPQGPYYGTPEDMARYATLRQQAKDLAHKAFTGEGSVRHLLPGT
ncbi:MAG: type VI secretion system Vgr family protein, partial [Betaproteobacteria bacterium]